MSLVDLDALEKLHAADPSRWKAEVQYGGKHAVVNPDGDAALGNWMAAKCYWPEIAQMIAAEHNAVPALIAVLRELRELVGATTAALADVHKMIDNGELVRDISKDHAPDWAIKAFDFVTRLQKIEQALEAARKWEAENV